MRRGIRERIMRFAIGISTLLLLLWPATHTAAELPPPAVRIVGGQEAAEGAWPWMVALVRAGQEAYASQFCGGSLVAPRWIMTAAHCIAGYEPDDIEVVAGTNDLESTAVERRAIEEIMVHPDFGRFTAFDSDLALLKLQTNLDLPLIGLADSMLMGQLSPGTLLTVTGWGNLSSTGEDSSSLLHQVDVPLVAYNVCETIYAGTPTPLLPTMVCAGYEIGGMDSCQGDSGGPLMANITGVWQQVGIVSFGRGCALPESYGVHTKVADFANWIHTQIGGLVVPNEHDFGPLPHSHEETYTLLIDNRHESAAVTLSNSRIAGPHADSFSIVADDCSGLTLMPGTRCALTIAAGGDEAGEREATLVLDSINSDLSLEHEITSHLRATVLAAVPFESAVENSDLKWFSGGDASWQIQTLASAQGGLAVASGILGDSEASLVMTEIAGPGVVSFLWKVSSEAGFDYLELYVDDQLEARITGEVDWSAHEFTLGAGTHDLVWAYVKDGAVAAGADRGFLDQVGFERADESVTTVGNADGGGGSATWLFLIMSGAAFLQRRSSMRPGTNGKPGG